MRKSPQHSSRSKSILFLIISWLFARVAWSIEISRLTILRMKPQAAIHRLNRNEGMLPPSQWVFERNKLYCLNVKANHTILIKEMPAIELN